MEELNDMLAIESNHVVLGGPANVQTRLFKLVDAKSMHKPMRQDGKLVFKALSSYEFNSSVVPDMQHPLHQFALDGLVATRVEEIDDLNTYSTHSSQRVCTVAIKGHAAMRIVADTNSIRASRLEQDPTKNFYLEPIRVLAKVFVVLVAVLVDKVKQRWMFQYEVVSSSNLDVDQRFSTGHKLYRKNLSEVPNSAVNGSRLTLRIVQLGSIVDTRFGAANDRKLTICVNILPYEPTEIVKMYLPEEGNVTQTVEKSIRRPVAIFRAFSKQTNPRVAKAASVEIRASIGLRRLKSGTRPSIGAGAAEIELLKKSISDMHLTIKTLISEVKGAREAQRDAIADLDGKFTKLSEESKKRSDELAADVKLVKKTQTENVENLTKTVVDQHVELVNAVEDARKKLLISMNNLSKTVVYNHEQIDARIKLFLDKQFSRYSDAVKFLIQERIFAFINAKIQDEDIFTISADDEKLKEFAEVLVDTYGIVDDENE